MGRICRGGSVPVSLSVFFVGVASLFLGSFLTAVPADALIAPQVYVTDVSLSQTNFNPGDSVSGNVSLWNYEQATVGDLVMNFQLLGNEVDGVPTKIIDSKTDKNVFYLSAGEKKTKSFKYSLPDNLPSGNFVFRVQLSNTKGGELAWGDKLVTVGGNGSFLSIENGWLLKDGEKLSAGGGVDYKAGEAPKAVLDVVNGSNFTISAVPKIITYKRSEGQVIQEDKGADLVLTPGQKETVEISFPGLTAPEAYLAKVQLSDVKTGKTISNDLYYRWVISGGESSSILFVNTDKASYSKGDIAEITAQITGPAHAYLEGHPESVQPKRGTFSADLLDQQGNPVCQSSVDITLDSGQVRAICTVSEDVKNPEVRTSILYGGQSLDEYDFKVDSKDAAEIADRPVAPEPGFAEKNKGLLFTVSVILAALAALAFSFRRKWTAFHVIVAFLVSAGIFSGDRAFAAVEVSHGNDSTTIVFNSPLPNQTYYEGDTVNFSGMFQVTSCGDGLFYNKVSFFIAEDKDVPLSTVNACSSCLGATSTNYGSCNMAWCDQVQTLNESGSVKIRKLGEIYPADKIASGLSKPYWVPFNQTFTIPHLDFSGPVRLYVQYSGTHWNSHWHWNITYQSGVLEAGKLRLCLNGVELTSSSKTMSVNDPAVPIRTYFDYGTGCSGYDVTAHTTIGKTNSPDNAVVIGGSDPGSPTIIGNNPDPGSSIAGQQSLNERVNFTCTDPKCSGSAFSSKSVMFGVSEYCKNMCTARADQHCQDEADFSEPDSCGVLQDCGMTGTRNCSFNWSEGTPGF